MCGIAAMSSGVPGYTKNIKILVFSTQRVKHIYVFNSKHIIFHRFSDDKHTRLISIRHRSDAASLRSHENTYPIVWFLTKFTELCQNIIYILGKSSVSNNKMKNCYEEFIMPEMEGFAPTLESTMEQDIVTDVPCSYKIRPYSISQEICTRFLLCCALLWLYIDWFYHIHQAYFTGTVAI